MRQRIALGVLLVLCGSVAEAQLSGRIAGSVVDAAGASVPNAAVRLYLSGGKKPLVSVSTTSEGLYTMLGVRPAEYDLEVEAAGFVKTTVHGISVDAARETPVPQIQLQLASVTQSVDVTAGATGVEINSAEVADTITAEDVRNLPVLDRDPLALLAIEPGVVSSGFGNSFTTINGLRTSFSNMTLDGINIQDNYLRDNALDYSPNKPLLGQVRQMTMVTSNVNAAGSGGATEAALVTPSGTNQLHGEALWDNRNSHFASNDWFSNQSGTPLPRLNQNQFGGSLGGPILKDRLFFFFNYEGVRTNQQTSVNSVILTSTARNGIFTYGRRTANLLTLLGTQIDPVMQNLLNQVPPASSINNYDVGDGRNTGGFRFNQRDNELRDNLTGKLDFNLSPSQALSATYAWNRDNSDRPDAENDYSAIPKVSNPNHSNLMALAWRWTPTPRLTNELRGGFNLTWGYFNTSQQFNTAPQIGPYLLTGTLFSDPVNEFLPQGRVTNTYNLSDDAAYQRGKHFIQFGYWMQHVGIASSDSSGTLPTYNLAMGSGQPALSFRNLPGISATDLDTANALLATLGGYIDNYSQTFQVTSRTSGFVPDAPYLRHFLLNNYAFYVQDKWKALRNLTVTLGLRYELPGVMDERNALEIEPVIQGGAAQTLLSDATLNFAGSSSGRPFYRKEYKEFAPNIGLAWDVFGNGKTAFRAGYSISYVNDQAIYAPEFALEANLGLTTTASDGGLSARTTSVPRIPVPAFQMPLHVSDNYAINPFNTVGLVDPNLHRPYVQQWQVGLQHEVKGTIVEARYVGNHMVGGYRAFDFNQVVIQQNGFLPDFLRAQNNGFLAMSKTGTFNPAYNASIPGSQPLTVFPKIIGGGFLSDPDVQTFLQTGEVADLATFYQVNGVNGGVNFFQNPYALGTDLLTNYSSSSYNALQVEARHRLLSGLSINANYTFSKVLSDADGDSQSRIQHFLDFANPAIERSRANFDQTHMFKVYGFYELPLGKGHALRYRPLDRVIGGWTASSVVIWQSGAPLSILSGRGTVNRSLQGVSPGANLGDPNSRSYFNTADTSLTTTQLSNIVKFQRTGNGPYMIAPSAINANDGTGVNVDGSAPFSGQVFFNPSAGTLGGLQRRMFDGPSVFNLDASLLKTVTIKERHTLELRIEAFNALNHPNFFAGDQNINSPTFGVISSTLGTRLVQFGVRYRF